MIIQEVENLISEISNQLIRDAAKKRGKALGMTRSQWKKMADKVTAKNYRINQKIAVSNMGKAADAAKAAAEKAAAKKAFNRRLGTGAAVLGVLGAGAYGAKKAMDND